MLRWMVKGEALKDYLQACKEADTSCIDKYPVLMKMFNTHEHYLLHMQRMLSYFGSFDGMRICEIGGGYGGQCKMICSEYNPALYHIIDLPEVTELQERYLKNTIAVTFTQPVGEDYDLCISNYALSEIVDNKLYIDEVLARSKHGYITCNTDFVTLPWPHKRYPDIEGERKTNYILVW